MAGRHLIAALIGAALAATASPVAHADTPKTPKHSKAPGAIGIQGATKGKPDARTGLTYSATPGARLTDEIAVVNIGTRAESVSVYPVDATSDADGTFALQPAAHKSTDVGAWVTLDGPRNVHVPPRTKRGPSYLVISFHLSVPRNATPGDHAGGIVVSLVGTAVNPQGITTRLDQRVGLRMYIRVSGKLHPALAVENLHLGYTGPALIGNPVAAGTATLRYRVHNVGNVILGATQTASISSWLGGSVQVTDLPLVPPLLPGASLTVTRRVSGVFPGLRISASVRLKPVPAAGASDPGLAPITAATSLWATPWELLVLALIVLAALPVFALRWWTARRAGASHRAPRRVPAAIARTGGTR